MIRIDPFAPGDIMNMDIHDGFPEMDDPDARRALEQYCYNSGNAFTARCADDYPIFCGAAISTHSDYATMISVMSNVRGQTLWHITRATKDYLAKRTERRIDTLVRSDFMPGHAWARRLGFVREAELCEYFPCGGNATIYRLEGY